MAVTTSVPVEEYLRTTYHPDREYVDGELVERNAGEYFHSMLQTLVAAALHARSRSHGFRVFTELRVRVSAAPRYRIPDICVKALPHETTPILEKPDLVIEVLSPDDRPSDMLQKISDYRDAGIPHIWIVDPYQQTVASADASGVHAGPELTLTTDLTGPIDFADLFAQIYETPAA